MVTSLYLVSLTVLLTFLVLTCVEKIRTSFNKKKIRFGANRRPRPAIVFGKRF
ncbi:hypothetical protein [Aquibacillus albus]|uniref:Uncharacterized protein n=1 Tax=Aquibacillus albus TaxID=1168171 RepID=A0ABS2MZF3_9BACI|nr:hypothetical protein [Aquibacillus albus]MBM7571216.1 hypothetical protein [Aquibacillus albus]